MTKTSDTRVIKDQLEVLSIAEGFFQSSVLFALLKLRVFERIGAESKPLAELAADLKSRPDTLARLLNAGVALKLLESKDGTHYQVGRSFRSTLLPSTGENYLGDWISNLDYFRSALSKLDEAVLKSAPTVNPSHHLGADKQQTRQFTLAMHNYASLRGKELAHFLDTAGCKSLLDLGCGPGTYAFHLGIRNPDLKLYLLDLPEVLEVAKEVQTRYQMNNEVHYLPKDATVGEVSGSYDMILVSNTLHMLGEGDSRALLRRLFSSVNPGGSLVIQAQFLTNIQYRSMSIYNTNSYLRAYKK
jgi:2-polyprenyl-3-methyl-5-hydroxy-6-metoxy-1,4-benzoquinol methylase